MTVISLLLDSSACLRQFLPFCCHRMTLASPVWRLSLLCFPDRCKAGLGFEYSSCYSQHKFCYFIFLATLSFFNVIFLNKRFVDFSSNCTSGTKKNLFVTIQNNTPAKIHRCKNWLLTCLAQIELFLLFYFSLFSKASLYIFLYDECFQEIYHYANERYFGVWLGIFLWEWVFKLF